MHGGGLDQWYMFAVLRKAQYSTHGAKMSRIVQKYIQMGFPGKKILVLIQIAQAFARRGQVVIKSALVGVMDWWSSGSQPGPVMPNFFEMHSLV